jgi:uncharacterized membrane protein YfcA
MTAELLLLVVFVALAGGLGGVLAGLLGVGGGIVIVPVLEFALGAAGVPPEVRMHLAVGTSLASIIPTALSSSRAHRRRGAVDEQVARLWIPPIVAGAALGAAGAAFVSGDALRAVFGVVALAMAAVMLLRPDPQASSAGGAVTPGPRSWPAGIGFVSALMGIGGGTLSVPALSRRGLPIHRAVGTSAWLGLWIAMPAAVGFASLGLGRGGLPSGSLGFVSLPGLAVLVPASVLAAPIGARIAHWLSRRALRGAFGVFLLLARLRMLWKALAA